VPNVLRAVIVEVDPESREDSVDVLETNVDDVTAEVMAACTETLIAAGARDVCIIPCTMKKGRPGWLVRAICLPADSQRLSLLLARETGTLGIRCIESVHRFVAEREVIHVSLDLGGETFEIPVKCAVLDGSVYSCKAEFSRAIELSQRSSIPARDIARMAEEEAWKRASRKGA